MFSGERGGCLGLAAAVCMSMTIMLIVGRGPSQVRTNTSHAVPVVEPAGAHASIGDRLRVRSTAGGALQVALGPDAVFRTYPDQLEIVAGPDRRASARALSTPISLNWRHPLKGLPSAQVIRFAELDGRGQRGPERLHTVVFADHGALPVISLVLPSASLFDPDSGLMVVGNGIFHAPRKVLTTEYRDPRWWKYPGNFHLRGKAWERKARMQFLGSDGQEIFQTQVGVRINGQMTRAFPQHALRLNFDEPLRTDIFGEEVGPGYHAMVLRSAGNDQIKAMLRDPFQHALCAGLPFELSAHRTCVLYINGAYWGIHHLRHRLDENELARRHGMDKDHITILEDEARFYRGDTMQVSIFEQLADRTARWNGTDVAWYDTLHARMDVEGFLAYMATQMILGNMDWPNQNVKFWRYTGKPRAEGPMDGRWYFIMGDSDLGYGVHATADDDIFRQVKAYDVPIIRLFRGMLRNPVMRQQFINTARALAEGPFSATNSMEQLDRIVALMAPEMERHTARWRRPPDVDAWMANVQIMRTFARQRSASVIRQLDAFEQQGGKGPW